jgi:flagellar motor switch protein FliG
MTLSRDALRKAAIVAASLDTQTADVLLERLPTQQADLLRREMTALGETRPDEQDATIAEFFRAGNRPPPVEAVTLELASGACEDQGPPIRTASPQHTTARLEADAAPFHFLRDATGDRIAPLLRDEHPQAIALVISHLPSGRGLEVLRRLTPDLQADVVRRLVELDETHPEILRDVERGLKSRISGEVRRERQRAARLSLVAGVLRSAERPVERQILTNVASHDPLLADQLRRPLPVLDNLDRLADRDLAVVFSAAGFDLAVLALAASEAGLVERVLRQLPAIEARELRRAMDALDPTRLSDVDAAEQEILHIARRLAADGRITLPTESLGSHVVAA